MPKITDEVAFGGATEKIVRLGLTPLQDELRSILTGFRLLVLAKQPRRPRPIQYPTAPE